jgi:hypothetical protein
MTMQVFGWGASRWGGSAWGGSTGGALALNAVLAIRENVVRLAFNVPVYFSTILDPPDASEPEKYAVTPVAGTTGLDGEAARTVTPVLVTLPSAALDGIPPVDEGRFVDVTLDRPLSAEGALYEVTVQDLFSKDLATTITSATLALDGLFRRLVPPQVDAAPVTRDLSNVQVLSEPGSAAAPTRTVEMGTIRADDSGDYAFEEGTSTLKKRVLRRGVTRKNGFAHLPGYGVGIPDLGKHLAISANISAIAADYQAQILREPDVAQARVRPIVDPSVPGLVRFQVTVKPKVGRPQLFDVPFTTQG